MKGFPWHSMRWDIFSLRSWMFWVFFREVPFGVVGLWKEICLASKGLVYETVSYFTVISVVFKEVVVVSTYLLSIWFCMLLLASAMWVPCIQFGYRLCTCTKRRFSPCIALRVWWGSLHSADDGGFGEGGSRLVAESNCSALQKFVLIRSVSFCVYNASCLSSASCPNSSPCVAGSAVKVLEQMRNDRWIDVKLRRRTSTCSVW